MFKICFITTSFGTIKAFVLRFAEYLYNNYDIDITFVCQEGKGIEQLMPPHFHYRPVNMERGVHFSALRSIKEMKKVIKNGHFDLIQYSTPNASFYASLVGKKCKVPVRLYCQWGMAYVGFSGIKRLIFKTIERSICKKSTHIEPDSRGNLLFGIKEKLYPSYKGSVIWNGSASGVSFDKFDISKKICYSEQIRTALKIPPEAFVFGFVGRITGDKGINELLSAFQSIEKEYKNCYLIFVGSEDKIESIDSGLYKYAHEDSQIRMCGSTSVVEQYLSAMDCFVLPSYREGFGMATIEAEAMGVPVIVTDIPGPTDAMISNETGLVIPKKNIPALIDAMRVMICDKVKRKLYGQNGATFVKNRFDQKVLFKKMAEDRIALIKGSRNG